jgi:hypothetical protein
VQGVGLAREREAEQVRETEQGRAQAGQVPGAEQVRAVGAARAVAEAIAAPDRVLEQASAEAAADQVPVRLQVRDPLQVRDLMPAPDHLQVRDPMPVLDHLRVRGRMIPLEADTAPGIRASAPRTVPGPAADRRVNKWQRLSQGFGW